MSVIKNPKKSKHRQTGRIIRMDPAAWEFLEGRKERTGRDVTTQIRELVSQEMWRSKLSNRTKGVNPLT